MSVTGGYPYFIQELGYAAWGLAVGVKITADDIENTIPRPAASHHRHIVLHTCDSARAALGHQGS